MKHQQVVPDYVAMMKTSATCLCLVFSGWVLFKLVHAIFWLPGYLEKNQGRLYERLEQQRSGVTGDAIEGEGEERISEESVASQEENTESDAIECDAVSKKDK